MSTRDFMIAVTSVEALKKIVGSNDQALLTTLLDAEKRKLEKQYGKYARLDEDDRADFDDHIERFNKSLEKLLLSTKSPATEPGAWIFLINDIIQLKQLGVKLRFQFNKGYKHYYVWTPYSEELKSRLPKPARDLLRYLDKGRPLQGKKIDHDGCMFSWLTQPEIQTLHAALADVTAEDFQDTELYEFHVDLVDALKSLKKKECDLVLGAH